MSLTEQIKKIFFGIVDYDRVVSLNHQLMEEAEQADREIDELKKSLSILSDENKELNDQITLLKVQIKKLLSQEKIDVLSLKDWYEQKYGNKSWFYDFDGHGRKDVKLALSATPGGERALRKKAVEIIKWKDLSSGSSPHLLVEAVIEYFIRRGKWTYEKDEDQFGVRERWQRAEESLKTLKGDCDDLAILMHRLIKAGLEELRLGEHYWRLKLAAGGTLLEGHAFNIWLHDDGEWYVVESTLDLANSYRKTWLKTPIRNNNLYSGFWGFARTDRSWVGSYSALKPYRGELQ